MKKIIIANWKMNPQTARQALQLADEVRRGAKSLKNVEAVLAPPFLYIPIISKILSGKSNLRLAAQDIFWEKGGAYTGEISADQLKASGVKLVIVGHSERRALGETNEIVNKKLKAVLGASMRAVLCVGEAERQKEVAFPKIIRDELHEGLTRIKKSLFRNLVVAYEPIWAIGTGENASPEYAEIISQSIKKFFSTEFNFLPKILYGGSVNSENISSFLKLHNINGVLIGGASLRPDEIKKIMKLSGDV